MKRVMLPGQQAISEPVLALMLPHGFQRIVIEELVTAE